MKHENTLPGRIVDAFLGGNLSILLILISLAVGFVALKVTPREEEPQIVVPLADILVSYPGGSAEEVERLVASRLERLLFQIDGVEYVYSMSQPGAAVITVRFFVGEDREGSLIKLYNKIQQNVDLTTPGVESWIVKPIEIDDVPIVNVALHSERYDSHELHRVAEEVAAKLQHIKDSAAITLHGGRPRVIQVYLDPERVAAHGLSFVEVRRALLGWNIQRDSGMIEQADEVLRIQAGPFFKDVGDVARTVVGMHDARPVYLRDVAQVVDGPSEIETYSRIGFGPGSSGADGTRAGDVRPAVTVAVAKKKGSNAVNVARQVEAAMAELEHTLLPDEVDYTITRDYGATANDKVNNLVASLGLAILTVIGLIAFTMGLRPALIIALAVPITYSLTLLLNHLLGFTINRVTLFALILALGLLVDDPIVGVENIFRHLQTCGDRRREAVLRAMNEVMPPIILSTLAIIASFLPMMFITGMMGPYMRPMAFNVPLAIIMSTVVALTITPWVSSKLLKVKQTSEEEACDIQETATYRGYRKVMAPLLASRGRTHLVLLGMGVLFAFSLFLAGTGRVPLKMLPFDNKNEFQLVVDMPEGTTLERTDAVVRDLEALLQTVPEVTNFTSLVGGATPMDFNGMVRHYYLRRGTHLADVRVNLLHRTKRSMDSHALGLRLRNDLATLGDRHGANIKLVEVPPGPPVLSTIVAEVYGQPHHTYDQLIEAAAPVRARMTEETNLVDVDDSVEANQRKFVFDVDRQKAGLNGISTEDIVRTLHMALSGMPAGLVHIPSEQNELPIELRLPRNERSSLSRLRGIEVKGRTGTAVQLGELGTFREDVVDRTIFHKNQERVVYVTGEMAGRGPAYAVLALQRHFKEHPLPTGMSIDWRGEGEWKITVDVFRDLGLAFAAALLGIYVLLVYETGSFLLPVVIMLSIPLSMIGIMPGFWILNLLVDRPVGGFDNPVFFTATAMIGMIALSGIVVRNGIILIDFIQVAVDKGMDRKEAIVEAGAIRFRPIFLTACTTVLGAWPITLDPIFSGLAWAIIFGMFVSTAFTLIVIPAVYNLLNAKKG